MLAACSGSCPRRGRVTVGSRQPDDLEVRAVTGYLPSGSRPRPLMTGHEFLAYPTRSPVCPRRPERRRRRGAGRRRAAARGGDRPIRAYSRGMLQRLAWPRHCSARRATCSSRARLRRRSPASCCFRRLIAGLKGAASRCSSTRTSSIRSSACATGFAFVSRGRVETIEVLSAGTALARAVRVRWRAAPGSSTHAPRRVARRPPARSCSTPPRPRRASEWPTTRARPPAARGSRARHSVVGGRARGEPARRLFVAGAAAGRPARWWIVIRPSCSRSGSSGS